MDDFALQIFLQALAAVTKKMEGILRRRQQKQRQDVVPHGVVGLRQTQILNVGRIA